MQISVNEKYSLSNQLKPKTIDISHTSDVAPARRAARQAAVSIGFDERISDEIALVMNELATNIINHARGGALILSCIEAAGQTGLQIESLDRGPGIRDVEAAITDGFSTNGSLGYGLGTIHRLMDELDIIPRHGNTRGTHITCKRWMMDDGLPTTPCPLDFGAATRPHPGMRENGDAFVIKRWGSKALVGAIDGLGHGTFARKASLAAKLYLDTHYHQPMKDMFRNVQRRCRATRGVVMALARFDFEVAGTGNSAFDMRNGSNGDVGIKGNHPMQRDAGPAAIQLSFASIGNIEVRVFESSEPVKFALRRGIIGKNAPNPIVTRQAWDINHVMVLHTDGLTSHWRWEDYKFLARESATVMAQKLLRDLAKDDDDATVLVVKRQRIRNATIEL